MSLSTEPAWPERWTAKNLLKTIQDLEAKGLESNRKIVGNAMLFGMPVVVDDSLPLNCFEIHASNATLRCVFGVEKEAKP